MVSTTVIPGQALAPAQVSWCDGVLRSVVFDDVYSSASGGAQEAEHVFLHANDLPERWRAREQFVIGEIGFGTGLNFLVTASAWLTTRSTDGWLHYVAVERYPLTSSDLQQALAQWSELQSLVALLLRDYPPCVAGIHRRVWAEQRIVLTFLWGDALAHLKNYVARIDVWYLDGFAPRCNPELWAPELCNAVARLSHTGTTLSTYSVAGVVRSALIGAGFEVRKVAGFGAKREMLCGVFVAPTPKAIVAAPWFEPTPVVAAPRHVVVVGAGIAGAAVAHSFARRGFTVDVLEQSVAAALGASGNPAGLIMPRVSSDMSRETQFSGQAFLYATAWLHDFVAKGVACGWHPTGVLQLCGDARAEKITNSLASLFVRRIEQQAASALAGCPLPQGGLLFPAAGWLSAKQCCDAVLRSHPNIRLHTASTVADILHVGDEWQLSLFESPRRFSAPTDVLCNSLAIKRFAQGSKFPLQSVRGQLLTLPSSVLTNTPRLPVCENSYVIPMGDELCVGATFDPESTDSSLAESSQRELFTKLRSLLQLETDFNELPLRGRVAFRAATPDHQPLVGSLPDWNFYHAHYHDLQLGRAAHTYRPAQNLPGLYCSVGHGSRGLVSAPIAAEFLADIVNGSPWPLSMSIGLDLHPARFFVRACRAGALNLNEEEAR